MKRFYVVTTIGGGLIILTLLLAFATSLADTNSATLLLIADDTIEAGHQWDVQIELADGSVGQEVKLTLWLGLQRYDESLTLGSGGIARWVVPEATLTTSGTGKLLATAGDQTAELNLKVLPKSPETVQLITTANSLIAYGLGSGMLIGLITDEYGNSVEDSLPAILEIDYPQDSFRTRFLQTNNGLVWTNLESMGATGRLRVNLRSLQASTNLELVQFPARPSMIDLGIEPTCVQNDGRDRVTLVADVTDEHGAQVVDGTVIHFLWDEGEGKAVIINGRALLRIPAPTLIGTHEFYALSEEITSNTVLLNVSTTRCIYD